MNEEIMRLIFEKDDVSWQSLLYQLVKAEGMDPWDVDVSGLTKRYIEMLKKLKEMDFHVSGKVVLAAAILLKIKSIKLISDDLSELDALIAGPPEQSQDSFYEGLDEGHETLDWTQRPDLVPHTPQPRQRKVSIYDLVGALTKALEVRHRRMLRHMPSGRLEVPEKKIDITKVMEQVYDEILKVLVDREEALMYRHLTEGKTKKEAILTFISLLNLAHHETRKIDLEQHEIFGDIEIKPVSKVVHKAS